MARPTLAVFVAGLLAVMAAAADTSDKQLVGKWRVTTAEKDGKVQEQYKDGIMTFAGAEFTARRADGATSRGTYTVDTSRTPWEMDFHPSVGPNEGKTTRAIVKLEGGTLKLCRGEANQSRPTEFTGRKGSGWWLFIFTREK